MREPDRPHPPEGYASWLDFAVETFDTRGPSIEWLLIDGKNVSRDAMRDAARAELRELRAAATDQLSKKG